MRRVTANAAVTQPPLPSAGIDQTQRGEISLLLHHHLSSFLQVLEAEKTSMVFHTHQPLTKTDYLASFLDHENRLHGHRDEEKRGMVPTGIAYPAIKAAVQRLGGRIIEGQIMVSKSGTIYLQYMASDFFHQPLPENTHGASVDAFLKTTTSPQKRNLETHWYETQRYGIALNVIDGVRNHQLIVSPAQFEEIKHLLPKLKSKQSARNDKWVEEAIGML